MKAVIGHYNSGVMIPADRIYNIAHIPVITGAASNPAVTSAGLPYVFRLAANDNVMGARMAEFARKELKEGQYKPPGTANGFLMSVG